MEKDIINCDINYDINDMSNYLPPFSKVSVNVIGYLFQFFEHNEIITMAKVNNKFRKALNSEYLWENLVLGEELFVPSDRNVFTTWKNYYFSINKLKANMKGGKPNKGFKARPMRGHPNYITAMACYDENITESKVVSGDKDGTVLHWVINEEGDYEGVKIIKCDSEVIDLKILKKEQLVDKSEVLKNDDKGVLVISEKASTVYVYRITCSFEIEYLLTIKTDITPLYQVEFNESNIFLSTNFHNYNNIKVYNYIESWDILTGKKLYSYQPTYPYSVIKVLTEEAVELKKKIMPKNYFTFHDNDIKRSFLVKSNKVFLIDNFDVDELFLISKYKSVKLHNLFVFDKSDPKNFTRIKVDMDYLIELGTIRNFTVVFGFSYITDLNIQLFSDSNLTMKFSTKINLTALNNTEQVHLDNFRINLLNDNYYPIQPTLVYNYCKVSDEGIFLVLPNSEFAELSVKCDKLVTNQYSLGDEFKGKSVNCVNWDKFKFVVGFSDNTIKVFSAKGKELWYNLLGGSMTVIPKSFVAHPRIVGFSNVILTKSKIIGSIGNLIREYSFNQSLNTVTK